MSIEKTIPAGTIVGEIEVVRPIENTDHYECAAWYRNSESLTGRFPVSITYDGEKPASLVAKLPGVVTGSNFTSLFGGNMIGKPKVDEDKGEPATVTKTFPLSAAFTEFHIRLFDEFVEPIANVVIETLSAEVKEHSDYIAKRAANITKTVHFISGELDNGKYSEWAPHSFVTYGKWIAEKSEILRKVYCPDATDRFKTVEDVVAKWKSEFAKRPAKWDSNAAFRNRNKETVNA